MENMLKNFVIEEGRNFISSVEMFEKAGVEFTQEREEELVKFMESKIGLGRESFALNVKELGAESSKFIYSISSLYLRKCKEIIK